MSGDFRVAVTGHGWMGPSAGSVDTAVRNVIQKARREVLVVTYELRADATHVLDLLSKRLDAGVAVTLVVNRLDTKPAVIRRQLEGMAVEHPHFAIYSFVPSTDSEDLHAKFIVSDRRRLVIGSANLSFRGLVQNHELAVVIESENVVEVAKAVDRLLKSPEIQNIGEKFRRGGAGRAPLT